MAAIYTVKITSTISFAQRIRMTTREENPFKINRTGNILKKNKYT